METLEALNTRRSIRKYKPQAVPEAMVEQILKAAMYAPTARNTKSNIFIVINKREVLDSICSVHPYAGMLKEAPLAIVVCGDRTLEKEDNYLCINGSAATQNILLAAHALGLGSVWLGVYGREDRMKGLKEVLNLPDTIVPVSAVAIGYPNETKTTEDRFDRNKIHYNGY